MRHDPFTDRRHRLRRPVVLLAIGVAAAALAGCSSQPVPIPSTSSPSPQASSTVSLAELCAQWSGVYSAALNADAGLHAGVLTAADWTQRMATATTLAQAMLADTPVEELSAVEPIVAALANGPTVPSGPDPAAEIMVPAFAALRAACTSNGTEIVVKAEFGG